MTAIATTHNERPVYFPAAGEDLFGIITEPTTEGNGVALVLLCEGAVPAPNRNRLWVRVARQAAALGYHSLRFDYRGVGESSGVTDSYQLDRPFVDDALAAVRCLEEKGIREVILAGSCFGARTALASAARIPELRGIALFSPPVLDVQMGSDAIEATPASTYIRKTLRLRTLRDLFKASRRRTWARIAHTKMKTLIRSYRVRANPARDQVSPLFSEPFTALAARGTPVLLAYGTGDRLYDAFREARPALAAALDAPGSRIEERLVPGEIHGFTRLAVQDEVMDLLEKWLAELKAPPRREHAR